MPRASDFFPLGRLRVGPDGAMTDVPGVRVGHASLRSGALRTGVTAILPHGRNLYREKVTAACAVLNGYGKSIGLLQEPDRFSVPVEDRAGGGDFLSVQVPAVRQDSGDAGPESAGAERRMSNPHARHVRHGTVRSNTQPSEGEEIARPRHRLA